MRRLVLPMLAFALFIGAATGQDQDEAHKVLERAIKAHGGEQSLAKYQAGTTKNKGRLEVLNGLDFTQEVSYQLPNKFREELDLTVNGNAVHTLTVFDGKKGGLEVNGKKIDLGDKLTDALRDASQLIEATRLLALRGKAYELALIGDAQVNDKPAVGIRVTKKGQKDVSLYFDKKTGLLAKAEHRTTDPMSGNEVAEERIITEYQKVEGLPQPKRVLMNRDGKKFIEAEVLEMKLLEKLDDSTFTVP